MKDKFNQVFSKEFVDNFVKMTINRFDDLDEKDAEKIEKEIRDGFESAGKELVEEELNE